MNGAREPNRFIREFAPLQARADATGVALVEDEIEHMQDGAQSLGPLARGGHRKWNARILDALLGPTDPLRHGGFGNQKCVSDLGSGEAAYSAPCVRDRRC